MSKIACLFPFSEEVLLMLKYKDLIKNYSLKYSGSLPGKVHGFINDINSNAIEYIDVWNDANCEKFDAIIVPENYQDTYNKEIKERLLYFEKIGKEIVLVGAPSIRAEITAQEITQISPISACVVFISGLGTHVQKSDLAIELFNRFNADGIRAEIISPYIGSSIMGFYEFPDFMYHNNIDECQKMIKFNAFVKNIDLLDPDVIIICAPGSIIPYPDEKSVADYGTMHFMITNVIPPDYVCCNLYAKDYTDSELKDIVELCERRIGKSLDSLMISNFAIDWVAYNDILWDDEMQFFPISSQLVDKYVYQMRSYLTKTSVYSMRHIDHLYNSIMQRFHADTRNFQIL